MSPVRNLVKIYQHNRCSITTIIHLLEVVSCVLFIIYSRYVKKIFLGADFVKLLDQQQQMINILSTLVQHNIQQASNSFCQQPFPSQQFTSYQHELDQQQFMMQSSPSLNLLSLPQSKQNSLQPPQQLPQQRQQYQVQQPL